MKKVNALFFLIVSFLAFYSCADVFADQAGGRRQVRARGVRVQPTVDKVKTDKAEQVDSSRPVHGSGVQLYPKSVPLRIKFEQGFADSSAVDQRVAELQKRKHGGEQGSDVYIFGKNDGKVNMHLDQGIHNHKDFVRIQNHPREFLQYLKEIRFKFQHQAEAVVDYHDFVHWLHQKRILLKEV